MHAAAGPKRRIRQKRADPASSRGRMRCAMAHGEADNAGGEKGMMRRLLMLCALVAVNAASTAQPLGRLFFTPAERAQLDQARSQKQRPVQASPADSAAAPSAGQVVT